MIYPKIFPRGDFQGYGCGTWDDSSLVSNRAQSIFEEYLRKEGKVVYGSKLSERLVGFTDQEPGVGFNSPVNATHTALLINIQEIEKKDAECLHKNVGLMSPPKVGEFAFKCFDCNKIVQANWSVVE